MPVLETLERWTTVFFSMFVPWNSEPTKTLFFFGRGHQLYRGNFNLKCFKDPILQTFLKSWVDLPSQVTCMQCYIDLYIYILYTYKVVCRMLHWKDKLNLSNRLKHTSNSLTSGTSIEAFKHFYCCLSWSPGLSNHDASPSSFVCLRWFSTFYHGNSPLNHHYFGCQIC